MSVPYYWLVDKYEGSKMNVQIIERKKNLEKELKRIVKVIIKNYSPEKIILFGSLADGNIHEWSDIDLIIIKFTDEDPWERTVRVDRLIEHTAPVDILVYTPKEIRQRLAMNDYFVKEFSEKGKVLYNG